MAGSMGPMGPQGPAGAAGLNWRGAFDCQNGSYNTNDVVFYNGSSYLATFPIGGCVDPPNAPWQLVAQKGDAQTGTAPDSSKLGGIAAASYMRKDVGSQTITGPLTLNIPGNPPATLLLGESQGAGILASNSAGNFHLDADKSKNDGRIYMNYFNGRGVMFGNGNFGVVASVDNTGAMSAASYNGMKVYRMDCTKTGGFQQMSCDEVCKNPAAAQCNNQTKGTCASAKLAVAPGGLVPSACIDTFSLPAQGGTLTAQCMCTTF
jgi:hypothetical protein